MTSLTADIIGICGSALFIGAFIYANTAQVLNKLLFNALNLIGAVLLLISLSVNFNLAAVVLEEVAARCRPVCPSKRRPLPRRRPRHRLPRHRPVLVLGREDSAVAG